MAFHRLTRTHPRLSLATIVGLAGAWLIPAGDTVQHILAGWNLGVWLYLLLVLYLSWTASPEKVRKVAGVEDENAGLVLLTVCIAAIASLAAVTLQLVSSRGLQGTDGSPAGERRRARTARARDIAPPRPANRPRGRCRHD